MSASPAGHESEGERGLDITEVGVVMRAGVLQVTGGKEVAVAHEEAEMFGRLPGGGEVVVSPGGRHLRFDRVVALPELQGPAIPGLPTAEDASSPLSRFDDWTLDKQPWFPPHGARS